MRQQAAALLLSAAWACHACDAERSPHAAADAGAAPADSSVPPRYDAGADAAADAHLDAPDGAADAGGSPDAAAGSEVCPGALDERDGLTLFALERVSFAGFTELHVTFCNPLFAEPQQELLFRVLMDDHKGMPPSDLTRGSFAVSSEGIRIDSGFAWEGTDLSVYEHHAGGWLTAPAIGGGAPILGPETTWIELHLGGIGDGGWDPYFRWDEEYLP